MEEKDIEKARQIANEEMDKRVKPKQVQTRGDPVVRMNE